MFVKTDERSVEQGIEIEIPSMVNGANVPLDLFLDECEATKKMLKGTNAIISQRSVREDVFDMCDDGVEISNENVFKIVLFFEATWKPIDKDGQPEVYFSGRYDLTLSYEVDHTELKEMLEKAGFHAEKR